MKKLVLALALAGYFSAAAFAQRITTDKVPALVMRAFQSKFTGASQQSWSMESKSVYEVDFFNGNKKQSATYDANGTWLATETEIKFATLPRPVALAFNKQFEGFTVQETTEVETPDKGTLYELVINKGKDGYEVQFSAKGELVKKEAAKSED